MNKFIIEDAPIVSSDYEQYKLAADLLGPDYHHLADYYLIILEIKKGDREYIKEIAENNYSALISNKETFDFAIEILGPNYSYLEDYYEFAIAIRDDDEDEVNEILSFSWFDPRDYDNLAYHIAKQYGNQKYINLIKDNIIKRNWFEKSALGNVLGENTPYKELHQYMKKL